MAGGQLHVTVIEARGLHGEDLGVVDGIGPFRRMLPKTKPAILDEYADPEEALFLTPYIESGNIDQARKVFLVGGPGGSSLFGLFTEQGPILIDQNMSLAQRNITWNSKYHLLYIDNPVGTGFSFTNNDDG
ncbi:unnamed protein product, partial [Didymodactylos carnosus]